MPVPSSMPGSTKVVDFLKDVTKSIDEQVGQLKDELGIFEEPKKEHDRLCLRVRDLLRIIEPSVPAELKEMLETIKQKHRKLHNLIFTA